MTQPKPPKPRRYLRTRAEYRWTGPKAAQAVEMSRQSAYDLRARMFIDHGPEFGRLWDEALAIALSRKIAVRLVKMRKATMRKATTLSPTCP